MKVNEINKALYEIAFIQNGEYGYHENNWNPSIDEREIDTMCGDDGEGNYVPATPLGYRDYKESRMQGLKNIFDQYPSVDLTNDKLHNIKREDDLLKKYDKIKTDKGEFIVVNDTEDKFFIVNQDNKTFYVEYVK
jgi:hypothetical protein